MDIILNITCQVNAFYSLESQKVTVHKSITVSNHQSVTDLYQAYIIIYISRQVQQLRHILGIFQRGLSRRNRNGKFSATVELT